MKEKLQNLIEQRLAMKGFEMSKQISSGGLLTNPTNGVRTCYSMKSIKELTNQGFSVSEDVSMFLWNAIMNQ